MVKTKISVHNSKPGGISLFKDDAKTEFKSTYELLDEISYKETGIIMHSNFNFYRGRWAHIIYALNPR